MAPRSQVIKVVDEELDEQIRASESKVVTKRVEIFGEEFDIIAETNSWLMMKIVAGDASAIIEMFREMLVREADNPDLTDEERFAAEARDAANWERLNRTLSRQRGLTTENLIALFGRIMDVVAERPTEPLSDSSRTRARTSG